MRFCVCFCVERGEWVEVCELRCVGREGQTLSVNFCFSVWGEVCWKKGVVSVCREGEALSG